MIKFWLAKHLAELTYDAIVIFAVILLCIAASVILTIRDKRKEKKDAAHKKDHR